MVPQPSSLDKLNQPALLLYFNDMRSDKLYFAEIRSFYDNTWGVFTRYGRYPHMTNDGWKCKRVTYEKALKEYTSIVCEKLNKGYQPISSSPDVYFHGTNPCLFDHDPTYVECIQLLRRTLDAS